MFFPLLGRAVHPKERAAVSLYCSAEPMTAQQPVLNPRNCCLFHVIQKAMVGLLTGEEKVPLLPKMLVPLTYGRLEENLWAQMVPERFIIGPPGMTWWFSQCLQVFACSVFNSSALPKGIWLSTCSCWYRLVLWPIHFWKELPWSFCKGLLFHFSLCEIFLFLYMLWLSMDVLLVCTYLRNIKLFQRFFPLCKTLFS